MFTTVSLVPDDSVVKASVFKDMKYDDHKLEEIDSNPDWDKLGVHGISV